MSQRAVNLKKSTPLLCAENFLKVEHFFVLKHNFQEKNLRIFGKTSHNFLFSKPNWAVRKDVIYWLVAPRRQLSPQPWSHYSNVIMSAMASQITSLPIVYSTFYSGANQRKHQSSASLAFVRGIHRWPVNSPHKGPVTRKIFPFDDVIML